MLNIYEAERPSGIILASGGQASNNIAFSLQSASLDVPMKYSLYLRKSVSYPSMIFQIGSLERRPNSSMKQRIDINLAVHLTS